MGLVPFYPNPAQLPILNAAREQLKRIGKIRQIIFKCRQAGISTFASGLGGWKTFFFDNVNTFVIAHDKPTVAHIFGMYDTMYDEMSSEIQPERPYYNKGSEMVLSNRSRIHVGEAKNINVGTGRTIHVAHGCLGPDNYVVDAKFGLPKRISAVNPHIDVVTHSGSLAQAKAVIGHSNGHGAISIKLWGLRNLNLDLTVNHKILTPYGFVEAGKIKKGDELSFPVRRITGRKRFIEANPVVLPKKGGNRASWHAYSGLTAKIPLTEEIGWAIGLFLAEGCILNRGLQVVFCLNKDERIWADKLAKILAPWITGMRTHEPRGLCFNVYLHGFCLAEWFSRQFYVEEPHRAWTKRLPDWLWDAPLSFLRGVIKGYFDGDGHYRPDSWRASTVSPALAVGIKELIQSLGYGWVSLSRINRGYSGGRNNREQWRLLLAGNGLYRLARDCGVEQKELGKNRWSRYENGQLHVRVKSVAPIKLDHVYDMEVDHPDHTYQTISGVVANTEVCRWPYTDPIGESLIPALSDYPGTIQIWESTAHFAPGADWFRDRCERARAGDGDLEYFFVEWWKLPEYSIPLKKGEKLKLDGTERYLVKKYGLTPEQIKWRREKIKEFKGDEDLFKLSFPMEYEEAWITKESQVFAHSRLMELGAMLRPPKKRFTITEGRLYENPQGEFSVWHEPEVGKVYFCGADVAEGNVDGDWSVAEVFEQGTNIQCAEYRHHLLPRPYGEVLAAIGRYYNNAQIAPEVNDCGRSTLERLREVYQNIYIWRKTDQLTPKLTQMLGWETSNSSKRRLVDYAIEVIWNREVQIFSKQLWDEMRKFVRDYTETGQTTYHTVGDFDDTVMAFLICIKISDDENFGKKYAWNRAVEQPQSKEAVEAAYQDTEWVKMMKGGKSNWEDTVNPWD